ncbi:MAG: hypothetical protein WCT77_01790 [Bacteroidota bacterium]
MKYLLLLIISIFLINTGYAQNNKQNNSAVQEIFINKTGSEYAGNASINPNLKTVNPLPLPECETSYIPVIPKIIKNTYTRKNQNLLLEEVLKTQSGTDYLMSGEYSAFEIDTRSKDVIYIPPVYTLSQVSKQAIEQTPVWLRDELQFKLRQLSASNLDDDFAQLILDSPEKIKDEVAFVIANMSYQSLTDARFRYDIQMIVRNAEHIYKIKDSLQYVRLKEYGTYANRDYYTTTEYKIYNPSSRDTTWVEVPRDIYYWYVVHPKLDQEGVYIRDNNDDNSGQRTFGYSWREFLWSNPDAFRNYTLVNKTTTKGTVATIPRFGEIMKMPKYLWNKDQTYYSFNRPFSPQNSALDVIGNWASQALPVDVTLPRAFQPNQIIMKHNGMCNEDAFLVAGATRTALIPMIYRSQWAEDHVFGAIYDTQWNHFEFFRGGLQPNGNSAYGITNLTKDGSYGWTVSITHGTRPDGYLLNQTKEYTNTATAIIRVIDADGKPVDGAKLNIYAVPGAYSQNPTFSGMFWTDYTGSAEITVGEKKIYLVQVYHPKFGWKPDSLSAYYAVNENAQVGKIYNAQVKYDNAKMPVLSIDEKKGPASSQFGFRLKWTAKEALTGVNTQDGQRSRFLFLKPDSTGIVAVFFCDSTNYDKFKTGQQFEGYEYHANTFAGDEVFCLPNEGKWYVVLSNKPASANYEKVIATCELLKDAVMVVDENETQNLVVKAIPNPFESFCKIEVPEGTQNVEILDILGRTISNLDYPYYWQPQPELLSGVYFAKVTIGKRIIFTKLSYTK